jgi:hypothetical protein
MPSNRWASPLIDDDEGRLDRLRSADRCYQHDIFCESSPHPRPAVSGELARHARGSPVISTVSRESRKTTDKCRSGPQIYPYFGTRSGVPNFHTFFDARFSCEPRRQAESSPDKEALTLCLRAGGMHLVVLKVAGQTRPLTLASLAVGRMSIWHFFGLATRRSASPRSGPLGTQ